MTKNKSKSSSKLKHLRDSEFLSETKRKGNKVIRTY